MNASLPALLPKIGLATVAAVVGGGLTLVAVDGSDAPPPPPVARAWVDHPLEGAHLPDGDVEVIVHATDPDGVAEVVLSIDGASIHTEALDGDDELVTVQVVWEADGPGTYELEVVGRDASGGAGLPATATFTVGDPPDDGETTTTTRPEGTTTSTEAGGTTTTDTSDPGATTTTGGSGTTRPPTTTTTRPTTTTAPCRPSVPRLVNPPDDAHVTARTPRLTWSYSGCGPSQFTIQMSDNESFVAGRGSYVATMSAPGSANHLTWSPLPMCQLTYYWRVRAVASGGTSAWSSVRTLFADCR